jgi:hypothetical protein
LAQENSLSVPEFFNTIEQTTFSTWIRESPSLFAFYFILLFHTIGLSMVVGANTIVDLRLLGVASALPLKRLKRLFRVMWTGLSINILTGLLLLFAYPTKALTNPVFYAKMTLILLAVITMNRISVRLFNNTSLSEPEMMARGKTLAILSLIFWVSAITAGRLLSETYIYLTYHAYLLGITRS